MSTGFTIYTIHFFASPSWFSHAFGLPSIRRRRYRGVFEKWTAKNIMSRLFAYFTMTAISAPIMRWLHATDNRWLGHVSQAHLEARLWSPSPTGHFLLQTFHLAFELILQIYLAVSPQFEEKVLPLYRSENRRMISDGAWKIKSVRTFASTKVSSSDTSLLS